VFSVKNIKICHPQEPSTARAASKSDTLVSNKMHALVEYETSQQAEKAVEKLNDERNWRKGLRVRTVLRRSVSSRSSAPFISIHHVLALDDRVNCKQPSVTTTLLDFSAQVRDEAEAARFRPLCGLRRRLAALPDVVRLPDGGQLIT
jgi:La-related protein 7